MLMDFGLLKKRLKQAVEFLCFGIPDDGEDIPADPATGRLHQAEDRIGRDGRVHGAPSLPEDIQGSLGGQGLAGCGHPVSGQHLGTGGEGFPGEPVLRPGDLKE